MESRADVSLRRSCRLLGGAVLVMLAACTFEYVPPAETRGTVLDTDTAVVLTALRAYYRDLSARDWSAFAGRFWPNAAIATVWQAPGEDSLRVVATAIADFIVQASSNAGSRSIVEESMIDARIRVSGDLAQAWVRYRARSGDPGSTREWTGLDAFSLLRRGDRWRIISLAFQGEREP
jgi:hypothetical protein